MTFSSYEDFVNALPDDALLGNLVWFTISNADVPFDRIHTDLATFQLADHGLRKRIRPIDAFQKATKVVAHNFGKTADGISSALLVRQVGQDSDLSYRHIMLERAEYRAGKKRRLVYEQVGEVLLNRGTIDKDGKYTGYNLKVTRLERPDIEFSETEDSWLDHKMTMVAPTFNHMMTHLDSHAVRTFVRTYLYALSAILAKENGGVYFIPQAYSEELRRLKNWVESIGSSMDLMPLVNFDESREMLVASFTEDALREVQQASSEITKILNDRNRGIREGTYDRYAEQASTLIQKLGDYRDLLGDKLEGAADQLTLFKLQLMELAGRIDQDAPKVIT
jgi:hypothetical protein